MYDNVNMGYQEDTLKYISCCINKKLEQPPYIIIPYTW